MQTGAAPREAMLKRGTGVTKSMTWDVIVVGAGMAGLTAARTLAEAGSAVLVLEARARTGGRILTRNEGTEVIELGAEFLHGRAPELWALIDEAQLKTYERTGEFLRREAAGPLQPQTEEGDAVLERLEDFPGPDCSFAEYIARQPLSEHARQQETAYVEGFNAADAREASVLALGRQQLAEDAIEGDRSWRLQAGYATLIEFQRSQLEHAGGVLKLSTPVAEIAWQRGTVQIHSEAGEIFTAARVVITLPLGVLQARAVRFTPLPHAQLAAAGRMRMGHAMRATLLFRRRLWPEGLSFLIAREALPGVWWTAHPTASLTLTGWVGGPRTAQLRGLDGAALKAQLIAALAIALDLDPALLEQELVSVHTCDWSADLYSRGAYSWVPVGGLEASAEMCVPVEDTLFFAGEHTDTTGHWGTVHAAMRSGLRAAAQVFAC